MDLKKWRKKNKLTLTKLSQMTGIPLNVLSKIERNKLDPDIGISLALEKVGFEMEPVMKEKSPKVQILEEYLSKLLRHCFMYIEEDDKIKLYYFTYEKDLISHVWKIIHNIDPAVLSGWYSDQFDIPYMYYRSYNVFDQDENKVNQLMSKFGKIKTQKMGQSLIIKLPEYPILDLMYLYKPRDEGGLECFGPQ